MTVTQFVRVDNVLVKNPHDNSKIEFEIEEIITQIDQEPDRMLTIEKIKIVSDIYARGLFQYKGCVKKTAERLHISKPTVYRYLTKIKRGLD